MAEIVNLRQVRKRKARAAKAAEAEAKRAEHGRAKAEKKLTQALKEKAKRDLEGRKRDKE